MAIRSRARAALSVSLVLALLAVTATTALAEDEHVRLASRLEPATVPPGGEGVLVVEGEIAPKLHVWAPSEKGRGLLWRPLEAAGVVYDEEAAAFSEPHRYEGEWDEGMVFEERFTLRVPFRVREDATGVLRPGVEIEYNACDEGGTCYRPAILEARARLDTGVAAAPAEAEPEPRLSPARAEGGAMVTLGFEPAGDGERDRAIVTLTPDLGYHLYLPPDPNAIRVEPVEAEGVAWGEPEIDTGGELALPMSVPVPFAREPGVTRVELDVHWLACSDDGNCLRPTSARLAITWPGATHESTPKSSLPDAGALPPPVAEDGARDATSEAASEAAPARAERGLLFPVKGEDAVAAGGEGLSLLFLLGVFAAGLGLALTPCVLPIIPVTVAVVTGGRSDLAKGRIAALLAMFVVGLCIAWGIMGTTAALAGSSLQSAFQMPEVIIGISVLFFFFALGMLGVIELQPPQWMQQMQHGAQQRGGSFVGAFLLGGLMALVASPCTGPFIAGLLVIAASQGSPATGFLMFAVLGLGMGAVLFAAGSLNFLLRPGPWMVWVRYTFGFILFGAALWYLATNGLIGPTTLFIAGFSLSAIAGVLVAWRLVRHEGEERGPAQIRGAKVALMWVVATGVVAFVTRPGPALDFTKLADRDHLVRAVEQSVAEGRPVVVDVWATWCHYCKEYDELVASDPELRAGFERLTRLKIDVTKSDRMDLRSGLGIPKDAQPFLVFIDRDGNIRRDLDVKSWNDRDKLVTHLSALFAEAETEVAAGEG